MAQVNDVPLQEVMELFFLCGYEMQRTAATEWESLELTAAQLKVLFTLAFENQATIGMVAHTLRISPPTASHLVDRLVQAGLVERVESTRDRRSTLASLTEKGEMMVSRLRQGRLDRLRGWLTQLGTQDIAALEQGLHALLRVMRSTSAQASEDEREEGVR